MVKHLEVIYMHRRFQLEILSRHHLEEKQISVEHLFCFGFSGRNRERALKTLEEAKASGMTVPQKVPGIWRVSVDLLTNQESIQVQGENTSGEVEVLIFRYGKDIFVTVGSDHTDRSLETISIEKGKQASQKVYSHGAWQYDEVKDHWDSLILRSWIREGNEKIPYQEGTLGDLMTVDDILGVISRRTGIFPDKTAIFIGSVPFLDGSNKASSTFWMELEDPVLHRKLSHQYDVESVPGTYD